MFQEAGFDDPMIVASNELDEDLIADLKRQGAKINAWGVGTHLITCSNTPALGGVYKLVAVQGEHGWEPKIKISGNSTKITDPGRKRIIRYYNQTNQPVADVLYLEGEPIQDHRVRGFDRDNLFKEIIFKSDHYCELSLPMVTNGQRIAEPVSLNQLQKQAARNLAEFPDEYRRLRNPQTYNVYLSPEAAQVKHALLEAASFYRIETAIGSE